MLHKNSWICGKLLHLGCGSQVAPAAWVMQTVMSTDVNRWDADCTGDQNPQRLYREFGGDQESRHALQRSGVRTVASCHALLGLWLVAKSRIRANERAIGTHPTYLLLEGLHMCSTRSSHGNDRHILQYLTTSHNNSTSLSTASIFQ